MAHDAIAKHAWLVSLWPMQLLYSGGPTSYIDQYLTHYTQHVALSHCTDIAPKKRWYTLTHCYHYHWHYYHYHVNDAACMHSSSSMVICIRLGMHTFIPQSLFCDSSPIITQPIAVTMSFDETNGTSVPAQAALPWSFISATRSLGNRSST